MRTLLNLVTIVHMSASNAAEFPIRTLDVPAWKGVVSSVAAMIVALLFLAAGVYHALDPFGMQRLFEEILVSPQVSLPLVLAVSVGDLFAGTMILIPRLRRWGAWLASALLVIYIFYFAYNYSALVGKECSCFPMVKRTVGPMFFIGDGALLVLAVIAGLWSRPPANLRKAGILLAALAVFTGVSCGYSYTRLSGTMAPDSITVDGKPFSLQHGSILLFFYDPHCSHCEQASKDMSKLHWKDDVKIVAIPTNDARFAASFLHDTELKAGTSTDFAMLTKVFPLPGDPPYGVAIENGRQKAPVTHFEGSEPADTLRKLGYVD